MPAQRLPWFKLWPEAIEHEKVAQLSDAVFRTWVTALAKAADQPIRWRFASRRHAAAVTGRSVGHINTLVTFRLLDDLGADGVWVHDWKQWQERYPSDSPKTPPTLPEHSANGAAKTPRKVRDRSDKSKEVRGEIKERDVPPATPAPTGAAAAEFSIDEQDRINAVVEVLEPFSISHDPKLWRKTLDAYGEIDLQAEALKQADWLRRHKMKSCSTARYLNWLKTAQTELPATRAQDVPRPPELCPECQRPIYSDGHGHAQRPNLNRTPQEPDPLIPCRLFGQPPSAWQRQHVA